MSIGRIFATALVLYLRMQNAANMFLFTRKYRYIVSEVESRITIVNVPYTRNERVLRNTVFTCNTVFTLTFWHLSFTFKF
jgi:hypothetical protein